MPMTTRILRQPSRLQNDLETSVIYQNPGWPKVAGQAPKTVK